MADGLDADDVMEANDTADGEVNELDALCPWFGRLGGGGAGAFTFTRMLDERERVESRDDLGGAGSASSTLWGVVDADPGVIPLLEGGLFSVFPCVFRLGGGTGFLGPCTVLVLRVWDIFGGVGGLKGVASGSS